MADIALQLRPGVLLGLRPEVLLLLRQIAQPLPEKRGRLAVGLEPRGRLALTPSQAGRLEIPQPSDELDL